MIGIVDYNAGNLRSVEMAMEFLKIPYSISKKPVDLKNADKIVFPGVGEAAFAMEQLKKTGFDAFLKDWVAAGKNLLGICLGSQVIFDFSEEGNTECLGLVPGTIKHFETLFKENNIDSTGYKIPHMGWNDLVLEEIPLFKKVPVNSSFYFVHSYVISPKDWNVVKGYAEYGIKVPAVIQYGSITAFQFHPEKSAAAGLQLIKNFAEEN
ncbi:MAG: imidazole glycerol phosphate synthase subunit HisH [Spirochaetaceae bacterium]|nr:imidazole glycerol phosphate synthase subunit HisH [Spirochaetaceae bacterium]MBP5330069.1 imidazole glycerol phosphate synthase subunit HisH [Spirochaetaceae bacterium]